MQQNPEVKLNLFRTASPSFFVTSQQRPITNNFSYCNPLSSFDYTLRNAVHSPFKFFFIGLSSFGYRHLGRRASVTRKIYHSLVNKIRSQKLCNLNLRFQEKNQIKCKLMHFHFVPLSPPPASSSFVLALFTSSLLLSSVKLLTALLCTFFLKVRIRCV